MTSSYSSSSCPLVCTMAPGTRNVSVSPIDVGCQPRAEANVAPMCLLANVAHANRVRVGSTPLGRPSLCLPPTCHNACPLPGTCHIPGNIGICGAYGENTLNGHEKETMQFLNDRLANYLEKVRQLERENAELEATLRERSKCHESTVCPDYQSYFRTIEELQQKILCSKTENARLIVQIDNAKLAADDFRIKLESEHSLRQLVEADKCGTQKLLDDATLAKADLEAQQESLKEEQLSLKSNHEQVWPWPLRLPGRALGRQGNQPPGCLEQWFQAQVNGRRYSKQASDSCSGGAASAASREILEPESTVNALWRVRSAKAQPHTLVCTCLQNSLVLKAERTLISNVEEQLSEIRAGPGAAEPASTRVLPGREGPRAAENEIATYRNLLESEDCKLPCNPCSTPASCTSCPSCGPVTGGSPSGHGASMGR
uniref:Keratin 37 n=1 Tax=Rhinopithecus bieti TaxID=61621 RepID=A0A2K6KPB9_RHIBE